MSALASTGTLGLRLSRRNSRRFARGFAYLVLGLGGALMLVPFFWLVSSSLKAPHEIFTIPPQLIPENPRIENYAEVMTRRPFFRYVQNTMTITVPAVIGQVLTTALAAYAFARLRFPGRGFVFGCVLATLMLPQAVTLVPVYILFRQLGWVGTFLPLIVPYWFATGAGGAFDVFLLRQFFLTIPNELEEAARLDGASYWTIFTRIILPLSRPALIVVAIFSFLFHWNDFIGPLIYLTNNQMWTLAQGVISLRGFVSGRDTTHFMMAMATLMILPIVAIFFVAQRAFIQGIALTGVKG
jgi:ABC-type glycerol-3-phosphate transport system permease component